MAPRKMLTKPVEKKFRADMQTALDEGKLAVNEGQTIDDVIEYVRAGIKSGDYQPGITFEEFYDALTGPAEASPGGEAEAPAGAIEVAQAEVSEPIDDLAQWLELYRKSKAKIAEVEEMANLAKAKITERLGDKTQATVDGQVVATYDWVEATRFDKKKLEAENPGLVEKYTVPNPHRRFVIK